MCCSAAMRRPLRSNRAMISPVRPRAKASGFTRIRVLSIGSGRLAAPGLRRCRATWRRGDRCLAVRAHRPTWVKRTAARLARVLQLAHAVRADQERALDVALAVRAG